VLFREELWLKPAPVLCDPLKPTGCNPWLVIDNQLYALTPGEISERGGLVDFFPERRETLPVAKATAKE
jgi:hypothetical protein